jgi:hypothetical protein
MTGAPRQHAGGRRPTTGTVRVELSRCCGALPADVCDCPEQAADLVRVFRNPLLLDLRGGLPKATPPAKDEF